jgi:hypothetical protein
VEFIFITLGSVEQYLDRYPAEPVMEKRERKRATRTSQLLAKRKWSSAMGSRELFLVGSKFNSS